MNSVFGVTTVNGVTVRCSYGSSRLFQNKAGFLLMLKFCKTVVTKSYLRWAIWWSERDFTRFIFLFHHFISTQLLHVNGKSCWSSNVIYIFAVYKLKRVRGLKVPCEKYIWNGHPITWFLSIPRRGRVTDFGDAKHMFW